MKALFLTTLVLLANQAMAAEMWVATTEEQIEYARAALPSLIGEDKKLIPGSITFIQIDDPISDMGARVNRRIYGGTSGYSYVSFTVTTASGEKLRGESYLRGMNDEMCEPSCGEILKKPGAATLTSQLTGKRAYLFFSEIKYKFLN